MYGPKVRFLIECSKGLLRMDRKLLFKSAQKHVHIHIYFVKIPEKTEVNKSHQENLEAYFIKWTTSGEPPVDFINHCHFNFRSNKGRVKKKHEFSQREDVQRKKLQKSGHMAKTFTLPT